MISSCMDTVILDRYQIRKIEGTLGSNRINSIMIPIPKRIITRMLR